MRAAVSSGVDDGRDGVDRRCRVVPADGISGHDLRRGRREAQRTHRNEWGLGSCLTVWTMRKENRQRRE